MLGAGLFSSQGSALGVGAANAESHIGEELSIHIPLFNVENPDSLQVTLAQDSASSHSELSAEIEKANFQLGVRVDSTRAMNEPYLNFTLDLIDNGNAFTKEFVVLLDLMPESGANSLKNTPSTISTPSSADIRISNANVMGPYDWAKEGQISEKFGAVLDGQSLWRVARRINAAMGVSLNQMMWALYDQNPSAFATNSIASLRAGAFLSIPDASSVARVSDAQAKARLDQLQAAHGTSGLAKTVNSQQSEGAQDVDNGQATIVDHDASVASNASTPSFQLTALDQVSVDNSQSNESAGDQSQVIIGSLAQTVGNLTQELIRKDKRISFLEEKVAALEAYSAIEGQLPLASQGKSEFADANSLRATEEQGGVISKSIETKYSAESNVPAQNRAFNPMLLLLLGLALLAGMGYLFKNRLLEMLTSLNLFGRNDGIEFAPSVYDEGHAEYVQERGVDEDKDYSIMSAVDHAADEHDAIEGISYLSFDEEGTYTESATEPLDEFLVVDEDDLSFAERFDRLIIEKDFSFARELLDFARYNEIDDQRYHCERLRLFQAMQDEDGFYEYYYEIEAKIPQFDQMLQTKISQLVVRLAQH
jgi:FimV-like protein